MKKIYTLISSFFFAISLMAAGAHPMAGKLTIRSFDNDDIKVVIDGKRFDPRFNSMMLDNLRPGFHQIKVFKERDRFINIFGHRRYDVVYNATINVRPRTHTLISIDRFNRSKVEVITLYGYSRGKGNAYGKNKGNRYSDWDENDHQFDFDRDGRQGRQEDDWYDDDRGYRDHGRFMTPISDREFSQVLQSLSREWFENDKMSKARQVVDGNLFTSAQVKQLVQMFSIESNKLELAKYAYANTIDKQNYYVVDDAFSMSRSKRELDDYERRSR